MDRDVSLASRGRGALCPGTRRVGEQGGALSSQTGSRFLGNTFWQFLTSLAQGKGTFLMAILIGRRLGVAELGLMAASLGFASIVLQLLDMRLQEATIKYVGQFLAQQQPRKAVASVRLFGFATLLASALALVLLALAAPWASAHLIHSSRGYLLLALAGMMVAAGYLQDNLLGLLRATLAFRGAALMIASANVGRLAGAWVMTAGPGARVEDVMLISGLVTLGATAGLAWLAWVRLAGLVGHSALTAPISEVRPHLPEIWRFLRSSYLFALCLIPLRDLDINLVSYFTGSEIVGRYRMAKTFLAAVWLTCDAAFTAVYPELVRLWSQRAIPEMKRFLFRLSIGAGLLAPLLYVAGIFAVPMVISLVLRPEFAGTSQFFACMTWGIIPWAPLMWLAPLLQAAGRPDILLRASIISGVLTAAAYVAVIPTYGAVGAANVFAAATPVNQALTAFFAWWTGALRSPGSTSDSGAA